MRKALHYLRRPWLLWEAFWLQREIEDLKTQHLRIYLQTIHLNQSNSHAREITQPLREEIQLKQVRLELLRDPALWKGKAQ